MIIQHYLTQNTGQTPKGLANGQQVFRSSAQTVDLKVEAQATLITLSDIYGGIRK